MHKRLKMKTDKFSLKSRLLSFKFAINGLKSLIKNEHNARVHLIAAIVAIGLGIVFNISTIEWLTLIVVIGIVFLSELFNSSIESIADFVQPEWDEKIRTVKDYSAAAVLISAVISLVAGRIIFIPKLFALF